MNITLPLLLTAGSKHFAEENIDPASLRNCLLQNLKIWYHVQKYSAITLHPELLPVYIVSSRFILILPSHLTVVLSSGLFHSRSSTSILYSFLLYFMLLQCPAPPICLEYLHNVQSTVSSQTAWPILFLKPPEHIS